MIEIGKNFLWGLTSAQQTARTRKQTNRTLAKESASAADAAAQDYAEKMNYLFRSAVEKNQLAYERARQQLATQQAKRAANGVAAASSVDTQRDAALQQAVQENQTQQNLQSNAAQETQTFQQKWQALLARAAQYRKQAKRKNRLGNFGQALVNLFK